MAKFFIDRPIFAWVIAILIMLGGLLAFVNLPVAQYPNVAAPEVAISGMYPGASAKTVEDTVTQIIEQQMNGIDNLMYMHSSSDSAGQFSIGFAFEAGTNIDIAQVQVQNKLALATPLLPEDVQRQGLSVQKSANNFLLVTAFYSDNGSMEDGDVADYLISHIKDQVARVPGVGDLLIWDAEYAMRIWLNPVKMEQFNLNPADIAAVVRAQNDQVTGGQVGAGPALPGQEINLTVNTAVRLQSVEEFENIIVKVGEDGSKLYLKDIARLELNKEQFIANSKYQGYPAVSFAIKLASGANALDTIRGVKDKIKELSVNFPEGLKYAYNLDNSTVISASINTVFHTLFEAVLLVLIIMYLFLQDIRATFITTITIPVVILGVFIILTALGYSINTLTLFGLVLAIGLLVDDAIVVVENVERLMAEEGLSPKEAAYKSMRQITGALVGVAMVISAVFVPMAFMGGSAGVIYRQFSITIVSAMTLSVVIAIILTPSLCATILKSHHKKEDEQAKSVVKFREIRSVGAFFVWFNQMFETNTLRYKNKVNTVIRKPKSWLCAFVACLAVIAFGFIKLPTGFLPDEDQGTVLVTMQLKENATFEMTEKVMKEIRDYVMTEEKDIVEGINTVGGVNFAGMSQSAGLAFINFKDWSVRTKPEQSVFAFTERFMRRFYNHPDAFIIAFPPPPILELANASGFDFELTDQTGIGHEALMAARGELLGLAAQSPKLQSVRPNGLNDMMTYDLNIDLVKAGAQSLTKDMITSSIAAYWGSAYINDFFYQGRTKKVYMQAEPAFRTQISDLYKFYVRNMKGSMVPFSTFLTWKERRDSPVLERYNGISSIEIIGEPATGYSTGEAMLEMERLVEQVRQHHKGIGYSWTSISRQERESGSQAPFLYTISIIVVFLSLAALYESWSVPLAIILVVPMGVLGAFIGAFLGDLNNDIYFQIGLLTVVGLSAKNSILIVEFAKSMHEAGEDLYTATVNAVRIRLRPILMTSLCFIIGVVPLVLSHGAGAGGQNALGTVVVAGVTTATILGLFFTPIFFVLITRLLGREKQSPAK